MRTTSIFSRAMLACLLAAGIAFPVPALAFAAEGASGSTGSSVQETAPSASEGASDAQTQNDPALFDGLVDGVDAEGILVTIDGDAVSLLAADDGGNTLAAGLADAGLAVGDQMEGSDGNTVVAASIPDGKSVSEAVAAAQSVPGVAKAQPNYAYDLVDDVPSATVESAAASEDEGISTLSAASMPNDPYAQVSDADASYNQYWLYNAGIVSAWNLAKSNGGITVATLDTGAQGNHEDLKNAILHDVAWDSYNGEPLYANGNAGDAVGHGTSVAGIIAGEANNAKGIAGGSYNAKIVPVKVWGDTASQKATTASVVAGYTYLLNQVKAGNIANLRVINMSLGAYGSSLNDETLHSAIATARNDYGIVTVCAGGNGNQKTGKPRTDHIYPADFDECVAVTALTTQGKNIVWSDYNTSKDISAPGQLICSTRSSSDSTSDYSRASGTSEAAPLTAGVFALLFAAAPNVSVDEACNAIYSTAKPIEDADNDRTRPDAEGVTSSSHGAIDADAAVEYLLNERNRLMRFTDVFTGDWFYDAVRFTVSRGIMHGVGGTNEFRPAEATTRAQIAVVLYNYLGNGEAAAPCRKPDVDQGEWYAAAVNWCVAHNVMTGYDDGSNLFGVDDALTREQMAKVMALASGADVGSASSAKYDTLKGTEQTSSWARPFAIWAVDACIINGIDNHDGTRDLAPQGIVERCQVAQIMANALAGNIM